MAKDLSLGWTLFARKFIATGQIEFLSQAIAACPDDEIRAFLEKVSVANGKPVSREHIVPLIEHLKSAGRSDESAIVWLLLLRPIALLAGSPEMLDKKASDLAVGTCKSLAALSQERQFPECEARFAGTLGTREAELRNWSPAESLLARTLQLYRDLAKDEPQIYGRYVATALNNLGAVLSEERNFPGARKAFEEALEIRRDLAEDEPHLNLPDVAMTLNNLGAVLRNERDFPAARNAFEESLGIRRKFAKVEPHVYSPYVATTLNNLGAVLRDERNFPAARRAHEEELKTYRDLAKVTPHMYSPYVATALNNLGNVLGEERNFPAARKAFEEGLKTYRELAIVEPHIYSPYVATALNNLGNVLRYERDFPAAREKLEEALGIRRELTKVEPHIYSPYVATTLNNLGAVLTDERNFPAARKAYEEGLKTYRELAKVKPHIYLSDLAMTLNNLGTVLRDQRDFPAARKAFEEALEIRRDLAKDEPHIYKYYLATTLNNLGIVLDGLKLPEACSVAEEAIRAAEEVGAPEALFLAKGMALWAYGKHLTQLMGAADYPAVFCCLAAMREGHVKAIVDDAAGRLKSALSAMAGPRNASQQACSILIAQTLPNRRLLLGLMNPDDRQGLQLSFADSFVAPATELFDNLLRIYDEKNPVFISRDTLRQLGAAAWNALPEFVRAALSPDNLGDVLISGDSYWNAFPWEALRFGDADTDFLGLRRPLTRWGPLTADALSSLAPRVCGNGNASASIVCPWNAVSSQKLNGARNEAEDARDILRKNGYTIIPGGNAVIGESADTAAISRALIDSPSILHYTGHGGIIGNEETLVLWDESRLFPAPFGRKEMADLKAVHGISGKLLKNNPFVFLNSCMTGRTREFGGQREDLVWAFLHEGAEAVVASPTPVYDPVGARLGRLLYDAAFADERGMAYTFAAVRGLAEEYFRGKPYWATWTLMQYHGNPYAQLPHTSAALREGLPVRARGALSEEILEALGARSPADVSALIETISARLR